jgi:hypothetical protein
VGPWAVATCLAVGRQVAAASRLLLLLRGAGRMVEAAPHQPPLVVGLEGVAACQGVALGVAAASAHHLLLLRGRKGRRVLGAVGVLQEWVAGPQAAALLGGVVAWGVARCPVCCCRLLLPCLWVLRLLG